MRLDKIGLEQNLQPDCAHTSTFLLVTAHPCQLTPFCGVNIRVGVVGRKKYIPININFFTTLFLPSQLR